VTLRKIVTDHLRSYPGAKAEIPELSNVKHVFVKASARVNNRAENSHQPTREPERRMRGFRDPERTQAFLSSLGPIVHPAFRDTGHSWQVAASEGGTCPRGLRILRTNAGRFPDWLRVRGYASQSLSGAISDHSYSTTPRARKSRIAYASLLCAAPRTLTTFAPSIASLRYEPATPAEIASCGRQISALSSMRMLTQCNLPVELMFLNVRRGPGCRPNFCGEQL